MGTRGVTGFRFEGSDKIAYQQFDSYPSGVGLQVVRDLHNLLKTRYDTERAIRDLKVVSKVTPPTAEQIEQLSDVTDLSVSRRDTSDWYCLLRKTQGFPAQILKAGYVEDSTDFMADSLFNEWGYIANFDDNVLEVYRGFQKAPHDKGRYSNMPVDNDSSGHMSVALIGTIPFDLIECDLEASAKSMVAFEHSSDEEEDEAA